MGFVALAEVKLKTNHNGPRLTFRVGYAARVGDTIKENNGIKSDCMRQEVHGTQIDRHGRSVSCASRRPPPPSLSLCSVCLSCRPNLQLRFLGWSCPGTQTSPPSRARGSSAARNVGSPPVAPCSRLLPAFQGWGLLGCCLCTI